MRRPAAATLQLTWQPAVVDAGSTAGSGVGVVGARALQTQFLAVLDDLAEYVRITGDTAGAEVLRRGLLAALDRLSTV